MSSHVAACLSMKEPGQECRATQSDSNSQTRLHEQKAAWLLAPALYSMVLKVFDVQLAQGTLPHGQCLPTCHGPWLTSHLHGSWHRGSCCVWELGFRHPSLTTFSPLSNHWKPPQKGNPREFEEPTYLSRTSEYFAIKPVERMFFLFSHGCFSTLPFVYHEPFYMGTCKMWHVRMWQGGFWIHPCP